MQIVEALADANVFDADGHAAFQLSAKARYVLYDAEAGRGLRSGALDVVGSLDGVLPAYDREALDGHSLLLPFIGRLGDAVVTSACLLALHERFPGVIVDIAATPAARTVFEIMPRVGRLLPYPIHADAIVRYDFHLSFEDVEAVPRGTARSCADVFSICLRTPKPTRPAPVMIPPEAAGTWDLPRTDRPRIALHLGRPGGLRTYPADLIRELAIRLAAEGLDVILIGAEPLPTGLAEPGSLRMTNLTGRTEGPADLAAVLAQADALVTGDSFPMHLAGAMGVATIALFTATDAVLAADYPSVTAVPSPAACSPCRVADGPCPLGHRECIAHREAALTPRAVADHVKSVLAAVPSDGTNFKR